MRVLTYTDDMRVIQNAVELLKGFDKSTLSAFVIVYASSLSSQKMVCRSCASNARLDVIHVFA